MNNIELASTLGFIEALQTLKDYCSTHHFCKDCPALKCDWDITVDYKVTVF